MKGAPTYIVDSLGDYDLREREYVYKQVHQPKNRKWERRKNTKRVFEDSNWELEE
jgi:hypothetical protein